MIYDLSYVLVLGLGKSGLSTVNYLTNSGSQVYTVDTNQTTADFKSLPLALLPELTCVIMSPGVTLTAQERDALAVHQLPVISDIELFALTAKAPVIAITGTNAKSTVTSLTTALIQANGKTALMGGNIGIPSLDLLAQPTPDYYVLELSSFQLETTFHLNPMVATVLNISPDHLDRHGSLAIYQGIKETLYANTHYAVINRHQAYLRDFKQPFSFGLDVPATERDFGLREHNHSSYLACGQDLLLPVSALSPGLVGEHNLANSLAALALTAPLNLALAPKLEVLKQFRGLPHRCVLVKEVQGVKWFNDSKGTNVGATIAALQGVGRSLTGKVILLLGGLAKGQDFTPLRPFINQHCRQVLIYGQDAAHIAHDLALSVAEQVYDFPTLIQAAQAAAEPGDAVLLSPACASYDMFRDFEDRGEQFEHLINRL